MVLVDTDVMIDVLRDFPPALEWMGANSEETLVIPGFVLMELIEGCQDKKAQQRVLGLTQSCTVVWLSEDDSNAAASLFASYRLSHGLDMIDSLVGQTALSLGLPLLTFNEKHYSCIPGLKTVTPYQRT